jgi:hypothetical protein
MDAKTKEILEAGKEYGLTGESLLNFLRDERAILRDIQKQERLREEKEREIEREERERERLRVEKEKEREEREKERESVRLHELELAKLAAEEKKKERDHEIELITAKAEASINEGGDENAVRNPVKGLKPKLPPFDESKEEIDAYIHRFEKYAHAQQWDEGEWATYLSALLKGESLSVYYRMSPDEIDDYQLVKTALLKRYQLTEVGFKEKFRSAKPQHGETFTQFLIRLEMYLTRWIEMGETPKTFDGIKDMLLKEQALNVVKKESLKMPKKWENWQNNILKFMAVSMTIGVLKTSKARSKVISNPFPRILNHLNPLVLKTILVVFVVHVIPVANMAIENKIVLCLRKTL